MKLLSLLWVRRLGYYSVLGVNNKVDMGCPHTDSSKGDMQLSSGLKSKSFKIVLNDITTFMKWNCQGITYIWQYLYETIHITPVYNITYNMCKTNIAYHCVTPLYNKWNTVINLKHNVGPYIMQLQFEGVIQGRTQKTVAYKCYFVM